MVTKSSSESGTLFIVATPIGNLKDITFRAVECLQQVDLIAAEDTRHSKTLLSTYEINSKLVSYHEYNKEKQTQSLIRFLENGTSVALISDAGTPGISDPGFYLIRAAIQRDITVTPIPGATAMIPALIGSGLPVHNFVFEGFPPVKKGRRSFFEKLASEERTIILYESPYRVVKTLQAIATHWGDRNVVVVRELTKKFEEFIRGTVSSMIDELEQNPRKGEFVLVVDGALRRSEKGK